ncbi:hypothetical protein [Paenibacillus sp. YIM B09110]|uniref:hypothetical protein n=1 Tax=Paenibacillus sp. YIM B09110 TaxID=3126102 RepID=UPI00301B8E34
MIFSRMARALDVHVAGWPLRVLFDTAEGQAQETLKEKATRLWHGGHPPLRWLQHEPRGHAAMRIGVVTSSRNGDFGLMTFDSEGLCETDVMDALGASSALTETGLRPACEGIVFETETGIIAVSEADGENRRSAICRLTTSALASYSIIPALDAGLSLQSHKAYVIEAYLRRLAGGGKKTVLTEKGGGSHIALASVGRDGGLLRAPHAGAVGAMLVKLSKEDAVPGKSYCFRGLAGGEVEGMLLSADEGSKERVWTLTARARLVASCEFVLDPQDTIGEGFLLR